VVKDQSGAVAPGAAVVATNSATNIAYNAITNETGYYVLPYLPPGPYSVAVELRGFKRAVRKEVVLRVGDTATIDFVLETGELTNEVVVTAEAPVVDRVSSSIASVVNEEQIRNLPLNGRQPLKLFYLQAGANPRQRDTGSADHTQQDNGNVDGLRVEANNLVVEGISSTDPLVNMSAAWSAAPVPLEAVGEYRVVTSNAAAEYGRGGGAQVQVVYKSGTNQFHGSAFEFHRNTVFNANNFFANKQGIQRPVFLRHQFGGSLGGPIIKNRTFFFVTYEGWREKQAQVVNYPVYTQTLRTGTFRFYRKGANNPALVDASGNPVVPAADMGTIDLLSVDPSRLGADPTGTVARLLKDVPLPNNYDVGDGFNIGGYRFNSTNPYLVDQFVIKGDHRINDKHQLSASGGWFHDDLSVNKLVSGYPTNRQEERHRSLVVSLTSGLSASLLNEFRVGGVLRTPFQGPTHPESLNRNGRYILSGLGSGNPVNITLPQSPISAIITFVDNLTWIRGNHSFKGGVDIRVNRSNVNFGGDYYLPVISTDNSSNPATIPALAGLHNNDRTRAAQLTNDLTGTVGSIRQDFYANRPTGFTPYEGAFRRWRSREYSFFLQDTWKVRPNLTALLGLRYELNPTPYEDSGIWATPVGGVEGMLGISGPLGPTKNHIGECGGCKSYPTDKNNFAPNLGFNWDPTGGGKWSISANYRITYDRTPLLYHVLQDNLAEGMTASRTIFPRTRFADVPKLIPLPTPEIFGPIPFNRQGYVLSYDPSTRTPYTQGWSLRVQREIMNNTVVQLSYVGNKSTALWRAIDLNQIRLTDNGFLSVFLAAQRNAIANNNPNIGEGIGVLGQMFKPLGGIPASFTPYFVQGQAAIIAHVIDAQLDPSLNLLSAAGLPRNYFRINPQFLAAFLTGSNSNSSYNALKAEVSRRLSSGLQFQVNYTFGKALTDYDGRRVQTDVYRDNTNRTLDKTFAPFDATHVVNANFVWEIPVGRGRRWMADSHAAVNHVLGGWQLNGIIAYASGAPFTIHSGRNNLTVLDASTADYCCDFSIGGDVIKGTQVRSITPEQATLFKNPAAGSAGTLAQYRFRGPSMFMTDASLFKSFPIPLVEKSELQFRFEAFNLFNNTNFNNPEGNINSPNFGVINGARAPRVLQFALRLIF